MHNSCFDYENTVISNNSGCNSSNLSAFIIDVFAEEVYCHSESGLISGKFSHKIY